MDSEKLFLCDKKAFRKKVERLNNLPTLPHLMMKFTEMAKNPKVSMATFGEELSRDQTITSKLLKLVNSAYYGFPGRIGTVTQALVLLGIDAVKGLIITSGVFDSLTPEAFPLWRHSLMVSLACRQIGEMLFMQDIEEIAVAGLLHDIGKVILLLEAPSEYRQVINRALKEKEELWKVEKDILGFDHTSIGQWLCEKWRLPEKLGIPIGWHHSPEKVTTYKSRTYIVCAADSIVRGIGESAESTIPLADLPQCVENFIKLNDDHIKQLVERIEPEMESIQNLGPRDLK